jgi:hypothetical protein
MHCDAIYKLTQLLEYWGANEGPIPWEFNAAEAKRVLGAYPGRSPAIHGNCKSSIC